MTSLRHACAALAIAALSSRALAAQAAYGFEGGKPAIPVRLDTTGMFQANAARLGPDMFMSGQPTAKALKWLHDQGVTTVINLRTPPEMEKIGFDEAAAVRELGMTYVNIPVGGGPAMPYSPDALKKFADALGGAHGKVLLHCTVAWRASHMWTAYLIDVKHVAPDAALAVTKITPSRGMGAMVEPVEGFLGRTLPEFRK